MNRLTFKSHSKNGTEYYRYAHKWKRIGNTNISTSNKYSQITQKLGKLEDIEKELGIPLEVLFKALKNGFYVRFVGLPARRLPEYSRFDFYNRKIDECNIKDYGVTWALTKEELENAED